MTTDLPARSSAQRPNPVERAADILAELGTFRETHRDVALVTLGGLVVTVGVAVGGGMALQRASPAGIEGAELGAWATFFTVFGVIYAIVAGLLIAELLGRYHRLSKVVQDELNAIEDVRDFLLYVDNQDDTKRRILDALSVYVLSVIDHEWPLMRRRKDTKPMDTDTSRQLYDVMNAVHRIRADNLSDQVALAELIARIAEITTLRTERLHMSRHHLSPAIKVLVTFMSLTVIAGFVLMGVGSVWVQSFMVAAAATAVYLLMAVIVDLHHPFTGMWRINERPFAAVVGRIERRKQMLAQPAVRALERVGGE